MTHEHFNAGFELKFLAPTGVFEGYASVFNVTDSMNDEIVPGAFKDSLDQFRKSGCLPPLLWQHNAEEPIGAWREMHEDSHGLFARGDLFINDIPLAKEAYKLLKENVVSGLSIGYRTRESHRDKKTGVRVLTKLDLLEVSLVTFPANEQARVTGVKTFFSAGHPPSEREFEAFLRTAGLSRKQAKGVVAKGHRALLPTPSGGMDEAEALARFRESLICATEDNKKAALELAFPPEKKAADVREGLRRFSDSLRCATVENLKAAAEADDTGPDLWHDDGDADDGGGTMTPKPADQMSVSQRGIQDISKYENFKPQVYPDINGNPTIGYGHKLLPGESFPDGITEPQGQALLQQDLNIAESAVRRQVTADLTQPQFDALVSFTFNEGAHSLSISDVLLHVNEGNFDAAANAFSHFTRAGGDPQALSGRRSTEAALFRSGIPK